MAANSVYNDYHFARDVAQLLQAHEASARTSVSIEQLIRRLSPVISEEEKDEVRAFFSTLVGIDSTKLIPLVAEQYKARARAALKEQTLPGAVLGDQQLIMLEGGLEKIFSKLASFLLRVTRRGVGDLRELSLRARLDGHKLAMAAKQGQGLAYAFDAIIEEVSEKILLTIIADTGSAYRASGTDIAMVSGNAWAARGSRSEYLFMLTDPLETVQRQYSEWFGKPEFGVQLNALRDEMKKAKRAESPSVSPEKATPLVTSIVLGLLFDALVQQDTESATTLALFLLDHSQPTAREAAMTLLPELMRSPLQITSETATNVNESQVPAFEGTLLQDDVETIPDVPVEDLLLRCEEAYRYFAKKGELTYKINYAISNQYLARDVARLKQSDSDRARAILELLSHYLQHDVSQELSKAYGSFYLSSVSGQETLKERSSVVLPGLTNGQKTQLKALLDSTTAPKEAVALAFVELLGLILREPGIERTLGPIYQVCQTAIRSLETSTIESNALVEPLLVMIEAEFRFSFLSKKAKASVFSALRVLERFRAGGGLERLISSAATANGSLAILLEGVAGQLFSMDTRIRIFMARIQPDRAQLLSCWRESESRIKNELESYAIQKLHNAAPTSQLELAVFTVKNFDSNSRRQSCFGVCLELLVIARELKHDFLAKTISDFIIEYMLEESIKLNLQRDSLLVVDLETLHQALATVQSSAAIASRELLLSGAGPELAVRFKKNSGEAEQLLSDHFTAAARVARRAILPARAAPFQKLEIALRYAEIFELLKEGAKRV